METFAFPDVIIPCSLRQTKSQISQKYFLTNSKRQKCLRTAARCAGHNSLQNEKKCGQNHTRRVFVAEASTVDKSLWSKKITEPQTEEPVEENSKLSDGNFHVSKARDATGRRLLVASATLLTFYPLEAFSVEKPKDSNLSSQFLRSIGIGDKDVYYPQFFEGTWNCFSTLISVETPQGEDMADIRNVEASRKQLGYTTQYQARFVPFQGKVIGDRVFTTLSLVENTVGKGLIKATDWDPSQPNRLTLTLNSGIKVENLVTKRSFDLSANGQFDTSEYSKQVFDNNKTVMGPPSVKASGNITRYRWNTSLESVDEIEAFQRISMYPVVGGTAGNRPEGLSISDVLNLGMGEKPTTVYKYIVRFERVKEIR